MIPTGSAATRETIIPRKLPKWVGPILPPVSRQSIAGGRTAEAWQVVQLTDVNPASTLFQFRLAFQTDDLRMSLQGHGQLEPIDLAGDDKPFRIIDGFRRYHAAKELGWPSIRAFVHREITQHDALRLAFAKNVVRRNLSPLERANAMQVATSQGITVPELARAFALSDRHVRRYLQILEFPDVVQQVMDGKVVTMGHARLLADYKVRDVAAWAARIAEHRLDVASLRRALRAETGGSPVGRRKRYMRKTSTAFRLYGFTIRRDAPRTERDAALRALREAIEFLDVEP